MEVRKVLKTSKGVVTFEGELTQEEHDFVITVGLNTLMEQGAIPFQVADETEDFINIIPTDGQKQ